MDKPIKPGNKGQGSRRLNAVAALNAMGEGTFETDLGSYMVIDFVNSRHEGDTFARRTIWREYVCQGACDFRAMDLHTIRTVLASALSRWIPRIPRLQTMTLWRGAALADGAGGLIRTYCQFFRSLSFYEW